MAGRRRTLGDDFVEDDLYVKEDRGRVDNRQIILVAPKAGEDMDALADRICRDYDVERAFSGAERFAKTERVKYYGVVEYPEDVSGGENTSYDPYVPAWLNVLARLFYKFEVPRAFIVAQIRRAKESPKLAAILGSLASVGDFEALADFLGLGEWQKNGDPSGDHTLHDTVGSGGRGAGVRKGRGRSKKARGSAEVRPLEDRPDTEAKRDALLASAGPKAQSGDQRPDRGDLPRGGR